MSQMLFKIEDIFAIKGRGLVLAPDIPAHMLPQPHPKRVTLKYPNGALQDVEAKFTLMLFNPMPQRPIGYLCVLTYRDTSEIPLGTEVWVDV